MAEIDMVDISEFVGASGEFIRENLFIPSAERTRDIREASGNQSKADVVLRDKVSKAIVSGDFREATRILASEGEIPEEALPGFEDRLQTIFSAMQKAPLLQPFFQVMGHPEAAWDLMKLDPVFRYAVFPHLPDEVRGNPSVVAKVSATWPEGPVWSEAPSIVACAALYRSMYYQPKNKYENSDVADCRHAAYMPRSDVFTCDKRNIQPLGKVLECAGSAPILIRTRRLDEVADVLSSF